MARLIRWWFVLVIAMSLSLDSPLVSRQHVCLFVRAQDADTVAITPTETTATPVATTIPADTVAPTETAAAVVDTTAPVVVTPQTTTDVPSATEAEPVATEAAPVATEAAITSVPVATVAAAAPTQTPAAEVTTAPVETVPSTPVATSSTTQVLNDPSSANEQETTASSSSVRGSYSGSRASSSTTDVGTGALTGSSTTKTVVICVIGGVGLAVLFGLLLLLWSRRTREDPDLDTPLPPDITSITFPNNSIASTVGIAATVQDYSVWKASGSSFASRDLPLTESTRAKLNSTMTRSSIEYDLSERPSQIVNISSRGTTSLPAQEERATNASSGQSFSIRGYSEFSVLHGGDSESSAATFDRYSGSSRLSSDTGRSNSGWTQKQVSKNLDMHRFSSTSSRASSIAARKSKPVSFVTHDLTELSTTDSVATAESTSSRVDVPDWYSVIESPTDNDRYTGERYTTSSLDSDNISDERESFEL